MPNVFRLSEQYLHADDAIFPFINNDIHKIQHDIDEIVRWVYGNEMKLSALKFTYITFKGNQIQFKLDDETMFPTDLFKVLRTLVNHYFGYYGCFLLISSWTVFRPLVDILMKI